MAEGLAIVDVVDDEWFAGRTVVVFESPDCRGRPYILEGTPTVDRLLFRPAVAGRRLYVADLDDGSEEVRLRSSRKASGECQRNNPHIRALYPARLLEDLAGRFTPPFRLR